MAHEYTDNDKKIARSLVENEQFMELLHSVFLTGDKELSLEEMEAKDDNEIGQMVRAEALARKKVRDRYDLLKTLGTPSNKGAGGKKKVPR